MAEPEAKPEPKEAVQNAEPPLIYKTWVLKVSIHCEACKRKVKRVLKDVEGVYETDIDLKQQKVVVKGNVESETLIKKLLKTGKHAELWPEKSESKGKKKGKSKKKEKQSDSESSDESSSHEDDKEKLKFEVQVQDPTKIGVGGGAAAKTSDGGLPKNDDGGQAKQPATSPAGDAQTSGGGGGSKKKKKKKKKSNTGNTNSGNAGGEPSADAPANGGPPPGPIPGHPEPGLQPALGASPIPANESSPRRFVTQYPPHYFTHPLYSVRYSTAYATCSQPQGESYYATPQQHSYAYMHPGVRAEFDPPPSDCEPYLLQPSDSLEMFSDENPNGCSVV